MSLLPWFKLVAAEHLQETAHLTLAEHGAYVRLSAHYWATGSIPSEADRLARLVGLTPRQWSAIADAVMAFFAETEDGWRHPALDRERDAARARHEERVRSGRKGGMA